MVVPERGFFAKQHPYPATVNHIFRIHMHKYMRVFCMQTEEESDIFEKPSDARNTFVFSERMNGNVFREMICPNAQRYNCYRFKMCCVCGDPSAKKSENRIIFIDCLRY